jgi:hypothetical protein
LVCSRRYRLMSPILGIWASSKVSATPDTGAMFPLQVITVGAAGASSVTFTNIPNTYSHLQVRVFSLMNAADNFYMQFNSDTAANYSWHQVTGDGSSAGAAAGTSTTFMFVGNNNSSSTTTGNAAVIDILDYVNTNKYKTVRSLLGSDANGSGLVALRSGNWRSSNAITSIKITPSSGSFSQYSQFALYGVKGAA